MHESYKFYTVFNQKLNKVLNEVPLLDYLAFTKLLKKSKKKNIFIFGNGGSSSIASHVSVDFLNIGYRCYNFNEYNLITCFSNDFGYENWILKTLKINLNSNDILILLSSSGKSKNIINAAKYAKNIKTKIVTLSGFSKNNPLRKIGDINFWINSSSYNIIEMAHHIILVSIIDYLKND